MEAVQKMNVLSNLYGVRTGISMISIEREKLEKLNKEESSLIQKRDAEIDELRKRIGEESKEYLKLKREAEQEKERVEWGEKELKVSTFVRFLAALGFFLLCLVIIGAGLGLIGFWVFRMFFAEGGGSGDIILFLVEEAHLAVRIIVGIFNFILIFLGPVLGVIISWCGGTLLVNSWIIGAFFDRLAAPSVIKKAKKRIKKILPKLKEMKQAYEEQEREILETYELALEENQRQRTAVIHYALKMLTIFENTFSAFLDMRDWKHVDLIIFYFETGRAENLKEALQQVDHQIQANMIAQAIGAAVQELKNTILYSAGKVVEIIGKSSLLLSKQLLFMNDQMNVIHSQLGAQNAQIQQIANTQTMLQSIRERSNTNSMKLMEDVSYIRTLADNAATYARNH